MQDEFKKEILKQLDKNIKELDKLLAIEGSITDHQNLPREFASHAEGTLEFFKSCKYTIEHADDERPRIRPLIRRPHYAPPFRDDDS